MTYGKVKNTAELTTTITCFTIQLLIGSLGNISGAASATDFFFIIFSGFFSTYKCKHTINLYV